jgi:oligopeptidase B
MIDAGKPNSSFRVFQPRMKDVLYDISTLADRFLIRTNKDSAKNFKLMECPLNATGVSNWKEVIPHRADVLLQGVEEFRDFVVLNERKDGLVKMRIMNLANKSEHYIDFGRSCLCCQFWNQRRIQKSHITI